MTREEIIKGLGEISVCQIWEDEVIDEAIKALEQEPKWIPVSERLPELNKPLLVTAYHRVCYAHMILKVAITATLSLDCMK